FLISAPEHDIPRRARAYLLTDDAVSATARLHAGLRPELDDVSQQALAGRADTPQPGPTQPPAGIPEHHQEPPQDGSEAALWLALCLAPDEGISVADLMRETGMSRRWVYYRLRALADSGRAAPTEHGTWRAVTQDGDTL
ncbi:MAG: hypothetical protein ACHP9Z_13400, partial [Streptosporangiales bacterium]